MMRFTSGLSQLSIKAHLLGFGLVCFLPAFIAVAFIGASYSKARQERMAAQAQRLVEDFRTSVTDELSATERVLQALAASSALRSGDFAEFQRSAEAVASANHSPIALRTPDGQQLVNTLIPFGSRPLPVTSAPKLLAADKEVMQTKRATVSDLYIGAAGRQPYVAVDSPVLVDGEVAYLLTMAITPDRLRERLRLGELGDSGWLATLMGRDGRIIARSRGGDDYLGSSVRGRLIEAMRKSQSGDVRSVTLDGDPVYTTYLRATNGWTLLVSVPERILREPVNDLVILLLMVLGLVIVCTVGAAWGYGYFIGRELEALSRNAQRMGEQLPLLPFRSRIMEVSQADQAISQANARIEILLAELDHRVKNTLAVIRSVVSHTIGREGAASAKIEGRIGALSVAHEALSASRWAGSDLRALVSSIAQSQGFEVDCDGPPLTLTPKATVSLAQLFQELIANAREHGALRSKEGCVAMSWRTDADEIEICWQERSSSQTPFAVGFKPGFGLKIVELCSVRQLGGGFSISPAGEGWAVRIRFPLDGELGPAALPSARSFDAASVAGTGAPA